MQRMLILMMMRESPLKKAAAGRNCATPQRALTLGRTAQSEGQWPVERQGVRSR